MTSLSSHNCLMARFQFILQKCIDTSNLRAIVSHTMSFFHVNYRRYQLEDEKEENVTKSHHEGLLSCRSRTPSSVAARIWRAGCKRKRPRRENGAAADGWRTLGCEAWRRV